MQNKKFILGSLSINHNIADTLSFKDINFSEHDGRSLIPLVDSFTPIELNEYYKQFIEHYTTVVDTIDFTEENMFSFGNILWESNTILKHLNNIFENYIDINVTKDITDDLVLFDRLTPKERKPAVGFPIDFMVNKYTGKISIFKREEDNTLIQDFNIINKKIIKIIISLGMISLYSNYLSGTIYLTMVDGGGIVINDIFFGFNSHIVHNLEKANDLEAFKEKELITEVL